MQSRFAAMARLTGAAVACVALLVAPQSAGAHTDFDYSLPTDGASVGEAVDEVTVAFTSPVTLVGNGFEVLDPQENLLMPFAVTDDSTVFRLQFDPPLAGGAVGVRYTVTAEDGHVFSGSFSFTVSVDAPPPTTTTVPTTTRPAPTDPPTTDPPTSDPPTTDPPGVEPTTPVTSGSADATAVVDATTEPPAAESTDDTDREDESSNAGLIAAIAAIVAVLAGGFVLIRSRRSAGS